MSDDGVKEWKITISSQWCPFIIETVLGGSYIFFCRLSRKLCEEDKCTRKEKKK